jgi:hypothetical protein
MTVLAARLDLKCRYGKNYELRNYTFRIDSIFHTAPRESLQTLQKIS